MTGQFELGSKHLEYKKQAQAVMAEIQSKNSAEAVIELYKKSYGLVPSENAAYDDYLGLTIVVEEIAKVAPETASLIVDQIVAQELLNKYATDCGKSIFNTNQIFAVLCSEPGMTGLCTLTTKAVKTATGWNIQGNKSIMKEQLNANKYLVFANDEEGKTRIFSLNKSDINLNQITRSVAGSNVVLNQVELDIEVTFDTNVAVINDNYERLMSIARTLVAAVATGIGHSAVVAGITVSKETKDANKMPLSGTQSIQFTLSDMFAELECGRTLAYLSANLIDSNKPSVKYATMAKVQASDAAALDAIQALQLLGNVGFIGNNDFADMISASISSQIKGGTNRVQRNQIYQYMLAKK